MTSDPIDYSRPVGWWCPVCDCSWSHHSHTLTHLHQGAAIPRYLPLLTPEPVEVDEVETGEAEVVTFNFDEDDEMAVSSVHPRGGRRTRGVMRWPGFSLRPIEIHINDCAAASANARKKREMK
jgi:hypothetical protein